MRKKKIKYLIENYFVTFFMIWATSILLIGSNIIGGFDIFLPYMIGSAFFYLLHLLLYKYLSFRYNRIAENILFLILPFIVLSSIYILTIFTNEPTLEEFMVIKTSRLPCGEKTLSPRKYVNFFLGGRHNSEFTLKRNNYIVTWKPNEENYYKYKKGDIIKVKVKKNFLGMDIIVQQNRDGI